MLKCGYNPISTFFLNNSTALILWHPLQLNYNVNKAGEDFQGVIQVPNAKVTSFILFNHLIIVTLKEKILWLLRACNDSACRQLPTRQQTTRNRS